MRRYLVIGGVVLIVIVAVGSMFLANSDSDSDEKPNTSSSNQQRTDNNDTTSDPADNNDPRSSEETQNAKSARYIDYSAESFDRDKDKQRVLVFVDEADQNSIELNKLLESSQQELPSDVVLYKTSMDAHKDIATTLGVTQAGVAVKFDSDGNLAGIYVAPETPDITIFQTSLMLDSSPDATPATD